MLMRQLDSIRPGLCGNGVVKDAGGGVKALNAYGIDDRWIDAPGLKCGTAAFVIQKIELMFVFISESKRWVENSAPGVKLVIARTWLRTHFVREILRAVSVQD